MFDGFAGAALVDAIGESARAESAAAARRLSAIAELVAREAIGETDSGRWSCDNWDAIAAQVAAALNISHPMASGQMYLAMALRDRLPKLAALLADGIISLRLATSIVWRTYLIKDPVALSLVDAALATDARRYGPLSVAKTDAAIDAIVSRHDPAAVRRSQSAARGRDVVISPADDDSGTVSLWGSLLATDGVTVDRRLTQMAHQVCEDDPRTIGQRRADALGTLAADGKRLACACANPHCPARTDSDPRAAAVVIHVVADPASLNAEPDPHASGAEPTHASAAGKPPTRLPTAQIFGGGTVPAPLLAGLAAAGAKVTTLNCFTDAAPESSYRPSAALARFIRCRDMTCRFPGCDAAAELCDLDHTIAYPFGPTHPSNLKCLCRKHHLLKTFWDGPRGWRDRQLPDGTVIWTAPTGHTYTTRPGSRLLFPTLCLPTGEISTDSTAQPQSSYRGLMMPIRRRTRQQDRDQRINTERALNYRTGKLTS